MTIRTSAFRGVAILSLTALGLAACEGKDVINIPEPLPPAVEVTVAPTQVSLNVGQTATAAAVVKNSTNQSVTWASGNTAVATVSGTGVITAVAPGSTVITATSAADATAKGLIAVTVTAAPITLSVLPTTATINKTAPGNTIQLAATVSGSTNQNVTWTSNATGVATVSATGLVTAVAPGTAVITATSAADANVKASSVIIVSEGAPVQITLVPATASTVVGGTVQLQGNVTGSTNTAITYRSSDATIASVNASGLVTGVAQGTAIITAIAAADTTKKATSVITVQGASVAIATVPTGTQVGPGAFNIETNVAVPAGSADSLMIQLTSTTDATKVFSWRCQTFTAAGAATQVVCPINPADYNPYMAGAQVLPNDTYTLRTILVKANVTAATATWGTPITTAYSNTVTGTVAFDNSLDDTDNDPDAAQDVSGGLVWFGGAATVAVTPSIFVGNAAATIKIAVDLDCDGALDAGEPSRTATLSGGTGTVTFPENGSLTSTSNPGIDNLTDDAVCFMVYDARDAGGAVVNTSAAAGNVIVAGTALNAQTGGAFPQNQYRIDNVEPAFAGVVTALGSAFDGLTTDVYLGIGGKFVIGTGTNLVNATATDVAPGVGGVTYRFFAVPAANYISGSQSDLRTAAMSGTEFTTADQLASTLENDAYFLVIEAKDALGNVVYTGDPASLSFGVDLTVPTIEVDTDIGPINDLGPMVFAVEDDFSGAESVRGTIIGHSVFEYDADNGVEQKCYDLAGVLIGTVGATGVNCTSTNSTHSGVVGVTEYYDVAVPTDENFYVITIQARDAAGNMSTTTITRNALIDNSVAEPNAASVTVANYTVDNVNNTVTVNGTVRDNIEVDFFDARWFFAVLPTDPFDATMAFPFALPQDVGSYGLPLTAEQTVSLTQARVSALYDGAAPTGAATATAQAVYLQMTDLAGNVARGQIAGGFGAGNGFTNFTSFVLSPAADPMPNQDDDPNDSQVAFRATATTPVGATNPLQTVYFYYWSTAGWQLFAMVSASQATVVTGETAREFRFNATLDFANLPLGPTQVVAIGVASDGDAVITLQTPVTVNP